MREKDSPRKLFGLCMAALLFFSGAQAWAFSFAPMSTTIGSSGAEAVMTYTVFNDSDRKIAVSIKAMNRSIDAQGGETTTPANSSFLIFPSRVVLNPMTSQAVKVQYRGPGALQSEAAYRIVAEQLPIDFAKSDGSSVSILLTYVAALYVSPRDALADVILVSAVGVEKENQRGIMITLKNKGTRHAMIANPVVRIGQGLAAREFSGETTSAINGQNILAGGERVFFMPWEAATTGSVYEGTFRAEIE